MIHGEINSGDALLPFGANQPGLNPSLPLNVMSDYPKRLAKK